jgi:hypothetical protein
VGTSPLGYPMKWGSHVSLKATFSAKVIASNTVGAFDFHLLSAHGTLAVLSDPFHIQEDVQVFITSDHTYRPAMAYVIDTPADSENIL